MPHNFASAAQIIDANDMTALVAGLRSCLMQADKLDLPMVAIHIEQACSWMADHGLAPEILRPADQLL